MYNRLDTIPACDGQTADILPRYSPRYAYALRGKSTFFFNFEKNVKYVFSNIDGKDFNIAERNLLAMAKFLKPFTSVRSLCKNILQYGQKMF